MEAADRAEDDEGRVIIMMLDLEKALSRCYGETERSATYKLLDQTTEEFEDARPLLRPLGVVGSTTTKSISARFMAVSQRATTARRHRSAERLGGLTSINQIEEDLHALRTFAIAHHHRSKKEKTYAKKVCFAHRKRVFPYALCASMRRSASGSDPLL